jgi:hypothetical protein
MINMIFGNEYISNPIPTHSRGTKNNATEKPPSKLEGFLD